jgi:phosphatidylserine decarboxylase
MNERLHFWKTVRNKLGTVGALLPTSHFAAQAMASEIARHPGPKRVLEVGAGTGAITHEIVKYIGPDDALVCVELEPEFVGYLQRRFETEPEFERVRGRTQIKQMSVLDLPTDAKFDFIISSLPFNNCRPEFVRAVFAHYQKLLKPEGVLSYIEYIGGRYAKLTFAHSEQIQGVHDIVVHEMEPYKFRQDVVLRNVLPAWVHHLRFGSVDVAYAEQLNPSQTNDRAAWPSSTGSDFGIDTAAVPFLAGLGGLAALLKKAAPKSGLWVLPALAAPAIALFFRDPARHTPKDPGLIYASADGEVLSVERLRDERFGDGEWLRIAVFLSIFDVHINRAPIAGKVIDIIRADGDYAPANTPEAEHNAAQYTVIQGSHGKCVVAQRVGMVARRIVNRASVGNAVAQGEKFGLIRFGSRTDVYVPANSFVPTVHAGQRVVGGETVIARLAD